MIKGVEKLRQLECMLRQVGRLGGGNALIDDVRRLGCSQPEFPNFIRRFAGEVFLQFRQRYEPAAGFRPNSSGSRPPLRKMLAARTTAY